MALDSVQGFLREHHQEIIRSWEELVVAEVRRVDLDGLALRDSIPAFLDELADWLATGAPPGGQKLGAQSVKHAIDRLDQGYDLQQVLREFRLLREAILRDVLEAEQRAQDRAGPKGNRRKTRIMELARLNAGLDVAISESIEEFVRERDRRAAEERARAEAALRESEARLRQMDRRKNEFLAVLSHELRNPLAPIRNSIYLLDRATPGSEPFLRARKVIERQTDHLARLVDDLLDVVRISRGRVELKRARVDLRELVRQAMDAERPTFTQAGIELREENALGPTWLDADATRMAQVVGNLLHNAHKFTPAGGTVTVSLESDSAKAYLRVKDTGVGMERGHEQEMFEAFAQGDQGLARTKGGLGLGLSLVKLFVEMHGGSVSATSEGKGRGTEFAVTLPLATTEAPQARSGERRDAPARRVLVIEDNADGAQTLADVLSLDGHVVQVAHSGNEGIAMAREQRPEVILCDIGLPDLDGYEVARQVRAIPDMAGVRLVALTGYAQPEDRDRAKDAGFDAHLAKPPTPEVLARVLSDES